MITEQELQNGLAAYHNIEKVLSQPVERELTELEALANDVFASSKKIKKLSEQPLEYLPLITIDGRALLYPNGLGVIQAQVGSFKTTFLKNVVIQLLNSNHNRLNLQAQVDDMFFCICDFELDRNEELPYSISHITRKLTTEQRENFDVYPFVNVDIDRRLEILQIVFDRVKAENPHKYIVLILDTAADIVSDPNSSEGNTRLIAELAKFKDSNKCSILTVIHENPGSNKARGHVGSGLSRLASTQWSLSCKEGVTYLNPIKARWSDKSKIPLHFDPDTYLLSIMEKETALKIETDLNESIKSNLIVTIGNNSIKQKDIIEIISKKCNISNYIAKARIKSLVGKSLNDDYILIESGKTRSIEYRLERVQFNE